MSIRDGRIVPAFSYFLRHTEPGVTDTIYTAAVEALAAHGGPDAVDALKGALHRGIRWAPFRTRRQRAAAAAALRKIGTPDAIDALRAASTAGPRAVRTIARGELARLGG
jgi:HEAT repeat protein